MNKKYKKRIDILISEVIPPLVILVLLIVFWELNRQQTEISKLNQFLNFSESDCVEWKNSFIIHCYMEGIANKECNDCGFTILVEFGNNTLNSSEKSNVEESILSLFGGCRLGYEVEKSACLHYKNKFGIEISAKDLNNLRVEKEMIER